MLNLSKFSLALESLSAGILPLDMNFSFRLSYS